MSDTNEATALDERTGFWVGMGVVFGVIAVLIVLGPAMQPRSEISDLTNALIGPGLIGFSLGAGYAFRRAGAGSNAEWSRLTNKSFSWIAFAFGALMFIATISG